MIISLFIAICVSFIYIRTTRKLTKLGEEYLREYKEYLADQDHHGIVLPIYSIKSKEPDYSLLPLFVVGFHGKIPYKIYPVKHKNDFLKLYYNNKVRYLWILGHGDRGGFCYDKCKEQYLKYSDRLPQKAKNFIAQLHCNDGEGQTLAELNGMESDHDTFHVRMLFQNSFYIETKIQEFLREGK